VGSNKTGSGKGQLFWWPGYGSCRIWSKVKWSRYRPGLAQRVGRRIALLFRERGTKRWWVVSPTPRPPLPPGKTRYPFYRRLGGTSEKSRPHRDLIPDRPARSRSLYRLSYPAHVKYEVLFGVKVERNILHTTKLHWTHLANKLSSKHVIEGNAEGMKRRGRRRKYLGENNRYWNWKRKH